MCKWSGYRSVNSGNEVQVVDLIIIKLAMLKSRWLTYHLSTSAMGYSTKEFRLSCWGVSLL